MLRPDIKKYFLIHKPYGILSQFSDPHYRKTLKSIARFPRDVYPVGRLDMNSEGLLLLTNDKRVTYYLLNPRHNHEREYWVLVEGVPSDDALQFLEAGVDIKGEHTLPCKIKKIETPTLLQPRKPPPRTFPSRQYTWLSITLVEGLNKQIRRMTAKIGHPTLRLVRWRISNLTLKGLKQGEVRSLTNDELSVLLDNLGLSHDKNSSRYDQY